MRVPLTAEMKRLRKIYEPYIEISKNGAYMPDNAPEEAKKAYEKSIELHKKQREEEIALW